MNENHKIARIAAVGDIHVRENEKGRWMEFFRTVSGEADVLLLCGDLTDTGHMIEAEILAEELKACTIPVIGVLGNHDYERDQHKQIKRVLESENVILLDGQSVVIGDIGFAGVKGFGGGFDNYTLAMFGESMIKQFVQETVDDVLKLDRALAHLDTEHSGLKKMVVMHYAPIKETVIGEPEQIWPFLGSSRLAEPLETRGVEAAFHGHAHIGTLEGRTARGVKVYNVAKANLHRSGYEKPFFIYDVERVKETV